MGDAYGRIYLPLDGLVLAFALDEVPVGGLIGLVCDFLGFLVRFPVLVRVEDVCIVDGQAPCLLLVEIALLVLIDLYPLPYFFQSTRIHLCSRHESPNPALELQLLQALRRDILVLLLYLSLNILR